MPDNQSPEKYELIAALGAEVHRVKAVPYSDPNHYQKVAGRMADELPHAIWANQFDNTANRRTHIETTGPEIWDQTGGRIDAFVTASGTGGTLGGVSEYLKSRSARVRTVLADPPGSALYECIRSGVLKATERFDHRGHRHRAGDGQYAGRAGGRRRTRIQKRRLCVPAAARGRPVPPAPAASTWPPRYALRASSVPAMSWSPCYATPAQYLSRLLQSQLADGKRVAGCRPAGLDSRGAGTVASGSPSRPRLSTPATPANKHDEDARARRCPANGEPPRMTRRHRSARRPSQAASSYSPGDADPAFPQRGGHARAAPAARLPQEARAAAGSRRHPPHRRRIRRHPHHRARRGRPAAGGGARAPQAPADAELQQRVAAGNGCWPRAVTTIARELGRLVAQCNPDPENATRSS